MLGCSEGRYWASSWGLFPAWAPPPSHNPTLLWHLNLRTCSLTLSFPSFAPHLFLPPLSVTLPSIHTLVSPCTPVSGCCTSSLAPPSAPSSGSSAKGGGAPWPGGAQTYSPSSTCRYRSLAQPATAAARLSSVSSHDSGFVSQDATYSKPPSPMPSDITSQVRRHLQGLEVPRTTSLGTTLAEER